MRDSRRDILLDLLLLRFALGSRAVFAVAISIFLLYSEIRWWGLRAAEDALARTFAGAGVGVRALPVDRQAAAMTEAAVATEVHQALDVHLDLAAKVAFDRVVGLEKIADLLHVLSR